MPKEIFFTIDGHGIRPETMPLGDLAYILDNWSKAIGDVADAAGHGAGSIQISLVQVSDGSNRCHLTCGTRTYQFALAIATAIALRDPSRIPESAKERIANIHARTKSRDWSFGIGEYSAAVEYLAYISPGDTLFEEPKTYGATSIVAKILRVGAEEGRFSARLRMPDGAKLTARIQSESRVCSLGSLLTKHVELHGRAIWNPDDWRLQSFTVESLGEYIQEESDPAGALEELKGATSGFWETVDVDSYLRELRSDSDGAIA
jgi:hypothetical protein